MEVVIRLQKAGTRAKKRFNFRVVAINRTTNRQGRHLDLLGHYDPSKKPATFSINIEKFDKWVKNGAQVSDTVLSLVNQTKKNNKKS